LGGNTTYEEVCRELDRRRRITLGFERIEALLSLLGNPESELRAVQVVGTNGKGTTAIALAAALEDLGHKSGAYLSPHVLSYTERVMVGGEFVSEETFAATMGLVMRVADANGVPASQFELLTAGALKLFRDAGLEWAVLEAGLGARHDATSVVAAEAVVLTNVGLDHAEYLGDTVEEIAVEKLANLRPGSTLILGTEDPRVVEIARAASREVGARLVEASPDDEGLESPVGFAPYAVHNARLGVRVAEEVVGRGLVEDGRARVIRGTAGLLPARFERHVVRGVPVVVDGGHNEAGLKAALGAARSLYPAKPLGVVFGVLRGKDVESMLNLVEQEAHILVLTRPDSDRALEPAKVRDELAPTDLGGRPARVVTYAGDALERAVEEMREIDGVVLVTGSLYTAAAVLGRLRAG